MLNGPFVTSDRKSTENFVIKSRILIQKLHEVLIKTRNDDVLKFK